MVNKAPKTADECLDELALTAEKYDSEVRLFFHLVNYVSLVKYDPELSKKDKSTEFRRFVSTNKFDLWDQLALKSDTRKSSKRLQNVHSEVQKLTAQFRGSKRAPAKRPARAARPAARPAKTVRRSRKTSTKSSGNTSNPNKIEKPVQEIDESLPFSIDSDLGFPNDEVELLEADNEELITNPMNYVVPQFQNNLHKLLSSYKTIAEDHEPISMDVWEKKVETDALVYARVAEARQSGLLAKAEASGIGNAEKQPKFVDPGPKQPSYMDNLLSHTVQLAKQRANLRKFHQSIVRRNTQSIDQYYRRLAGAEDREKKETERLIKQVAKRTAQEVLKKWKLALKIVEQRKQAILDEEKREKGKEYLNEILDKSAKLIESRVNDMESESSTDTDMESVEDSQLTVEQLREKYRNLPELENENSDTDGNSDRIDENENDENGNDIDENGDEMESESDENDNNEVDKSDDEKVDVPSKDALKIYNEISENESESALSSSESESEASEDSDEPRFGLASLLGGNLEDSDDDEDSDDENNDSARITEITDEVEEMQTEEKKEKENEENEDEMEVDKIEVDKMEVDKMEVDKDSESNNNSDNDSNDSNDSNEDSNDDSDSNDDLEEEEEIKEIKEDIKEDEEDEEKRKEEVKEELESVKTERRHRIEQPALLRGHLREYQRNGLDWMAGLVMSGTNGILADEMGLGKTIQTISLMAWLASEKHIWGPHLVVVPTSVMLNWEMEFKRFLPGFKILTYFGTPQQRKRKRRGWNKEDTWHVVITSYQLVIQDQAVFRNKRWQFMVLDEAHNIKNFRSQRWQALLNFNAQFRLLLTGTPLQNNLMELWSLLYFLMPSGRATQMMPAGFASLEDFQDWFAKPVDKMVQNNEEPDDEARATVSKLHQVLRPYLLRRLKKDVEKQMPAKYEHVLFCRLSKRQRYLYDDFMSRASTKATLTSGNFMSILNCLMQLRKVCNHPDLFEVRPILTSFSLDKSVSNDFGAVASKFLVPSTALDSRPLHNLSVWFASMEHEPMKLAIRRQELNASSILEKLCTDIETEIKNDVLREGVPAPNYSSIAEWAKYSIYKRRTEALARQQHLTYLNKLRLAKRPLFGTDCLDALKIFELPSLGVRSYDDRAMLMKPLIERFACITPAVTVLDQPQLTLGESVADSVYLPINPQNQFVHSTTFHEAQVRLSIAFPDKRLIQYDCGKLQTLAHLLHELISKGHRCLIFTQMTRVLDILEQFLNLHGWRYLRLDGATRIEQRQALTERFNKDASVPVFILSTRSGGLGINLTGADTVIFYDSDWNPAMDRQCQDRCHRIGQTRDVHIYRLVSEFTVESNILRKATQKTLLDNVVIQEGDFTTDHFTKMSVQDIMGNDAGRNSKGITLEELRGTETKQMEAALAETEDKDDQLAANQALTESTLDQHEFDDAEAKTTTQPDGTQTTTQPDGTQTVTQPNSADGAEPAAGTNAVPAAETVAETVAEPATEPVNQAAEEPEVVEIYEINEIDEKNSANDQIGHIDDWMIAAIERGGLFDY